MLTKKSIPFRNELFVLCDSNPQSLLTTWEMLIEYAFDLFLIGDTMIFDRTANWALFNYHEGQLFFAKDNVYDPSGNELYIQYLKEKISAV